MASRGARGTPAVSGQSSWAGESTFSWSTRSRSVSYRPKLHPLPTHGRFTAAPPPLGQATEIQVALVWAGITSHSFISERRAEIGAQKETEPDSQVPPRQVGLLWEGFPGGGTLGHFGWALASTRDSPVLGGPVGGFSLSPLSARVAVTSLSPRDPGGPTLSLGPLEVWLGRCG